MELGQQQRPVPPNEKFEVDKKERKQCSLCCALASSGICFTIACIAYIPGAWVTLEKRLVTWPRRLDRLMFMPLPVALASFTHQYMMSQALWSKNRKQVWSINWETLGWNYLLWGAIVVSCTTFSRQVLVRYSRDYRLRQWEYTRIRRAIPNPYMPQMWGTVTGTLDYVHFLWFISFYHLAWSGLSFGLDNALNAHYGIFYRSVSYSRLCSPRWREWREQQLKDFVYTEASTGETLGYRRWGTPISSDPWRLGDSASGEKS
jgi:hypothetical protein